MSHIISHIVTYIANKITQEELRSLREQGIVIFDPGKLYINIIGKDKIGNTWKLLIVDKIEIKKDGRKSNLFRTTLKSFNITHNNLIMGAEQNFDTMRKFTENFFTLPDYDSTHVNI